MNSQYLQLISIISDSPSLSFQSEGFKEIKIIERPGFKYCYREIDHHISQKDILLAYEYNQFTHKNKVATIPFQFKPLDRTIEVVLASLDQKSEKILQVLENIKNTEEVTLMLSLLEKPMIPQLLRTAETPSLKYIKGKFEQKKERINLEKYIPQLQLLLENTPTFLDSSFNVKDDHIMIVLKIKRTVVNEDLLEIFEPLSKFMSSRVLMRTPNYVFSDIELDFNL
ncbi:MAG: hypothetical protein RIC03_13615 [Cyclobacteriaceae bacterium]